MDPTVGTSSSAPETNGPPPCPEAATVLERLRSFTRDDKRFILRELLRDMLGLQPNGEWCLVNDDRTTFLYLMSPVRRAQLTVTQERIAQWKEEIATGKLVPLSETVAWMKEQLAREQQ